MADGGHSRQNEPYVHATHTSWEVSAPHSRTNTSFTPDRSSLSSAAANPNQNTANHQGLWRGGLSGDGMEHAVGQHRPHPRAQCTTGWYPQPPPISALNLVWNCQGWYRRQLAGGFSVPPHVSTEAVVRSKRDRRSSSPRYMPAQHTHTQATTHTSGHRHKRSQTQATTDTGDHRHKRSQTQAHTQATTHTDDHTHRRPHTQTTTHTGDHTHRQP